MTTDSQVAVSHVDDEYGRHDDPQHHVTPIRVYLGVLVLLLVATGLTVWVAFVDLGQFSTPLALVIATIKASAVILYFMHVRYSTRLTWTVVLGAFFWLAVLFALTLADYLSRHVPLT